MPDFENTSRKQREEQIYDVVGKQLQGDKSLATDATLQGLLADKRKALCDLPSREEIERRWRNIAKRLHR